MWMHRPNLMRAALGGTALFTATNHGAFSLYNNSSGPHLLRLWAMIDQGGNQATVSVQNSRLTTHDIGTITPAVPGEAMPPGTIDRQDLAASPAANFNIPGLITLPSLFTSTAPFVVLRPGWSFVVTEITAAQPMALSFWWDYVFPIELLKPDIGDPEIDG